MAYGGIMFYNLHMPLYILGTFTEYPLINRYGSLKFGEIGIHKKSLRNNS